MRTDEMTGDEFRAYMQTQRESVYLPLAYRRAWRVFAYTRSFPAEVKPFASTRLEGFGWDERGSLVWPDKVREIRAFAASGSRLFGASAHLSFPVAGGPQRRGGAPPPARSGGQATVVVRKQPLQLPVGRHQPAARAERRRAPAQPRHASPVSACILSFVTRPRESAAASKGFHAAAREHRTSRTRIWASTDPFPPPRLASHRALGAVNHESRCTPLSWASSPST